MRIVTLLPAATECVAAIGLAESLVGRSHECDWPTGVSELPAVTAPAVPMAGDSAAIQGAVRDALRDGLSLYRVDVDRLRALAPDLIVTQDQCDVCAVTPAQLQAQACDVLGPQVRIVSLAPMSYGEVADDLARLGAVCGADAPGAAAAQRMRDRAATIAAWPAPDPRPRVCVLEWLDPLMAGGHWTPELVELAGGTNVLGEAGARSGVVTWAQVEAAAPEVLIVAPCGFDVERTWAERAALTSRPGFHALPAARTGRAWVVDGNAWVNRPGPRLAETLEVFARLIRRGEESQAPAYTDRIRALR